MEQLGVNFKYLGIQVVVLLFIGAWITLTLVSLFKLKRQSLSGISLVLWVLVIVGFPLFGAATFLLVGTNDESQLPQQP